MEITNGLTRRAFLLAGPLTAVLGCEEARPRKYGLMTVEGHTAHRARTGEFLRVLVDGKDVTSRCLRANDRRGYALCYRRGADGRFYVGLDGRLETELLRGNVEYVVRRDEGTAPDTVPITMEV